MVVKKLSNFSIDNILDKNNRSMETSHICGKNNQGKEYQKHIYYTNIFPDELVDTQVSTETSAIRYDLDVKSYTFDYYQAALNQYMESFRKTSLGTDNTEKDKEFFKEFRCRYTPETLNSQRTNTNNTFDHDIYGSERVGHVRFSTNQSNKLQEVFEKHSYITPGERRNLAKKLNLSEKQVKTWFQNRRAKIKRTFSFKST